MANEFRHGSVGTELSQAEWESITGHSFDSQATGDMLYATSGTQLSRLAIGAANRVLTSTGAAPQWSTTLSHEAGGIEADISAITTGGILHGTGAGAIGILAGATDGSGLLKHEVGGIEADVSAITTGGILRGSGAGTIGILASFLTAGDLVRHENGGIEADISAITTGGILRGTGAGTMGILASFLDASGRVKHEFGGIEADISAIAKGGLLSGTGTGTMGVTTVGSNGQLLEADSTAGGGVSWVDPVPNTGVRCTDASTQSISHNSDTAINFDTEDFDTDTFHDTVTNNTRLTIPSGKDGKYLILGGFEVQTLDASDEFRASIRLNGTTKLAAQGSAQGNNSSLVDTGIVVSTIYDLVATDYVELMAFNDESASGAKTITAQWFGMIRVG